MKVVGHRGARGLAPENTMAALKKGLEFGVDEIEVDIRITADGVPVLHHDQRLYRKIDIATTSLKDLRTAKPDLATLAEAIKFVNKRAVLMLEVKPGVPTQKIVGVVKEFLDKDWKASNFFWASFSQKTLRRLHAAIPDIECVVIEQFSGVWATYRARQLGTKRISMWQLNMWSGFISSMSRSGYKLYAWTLNDPAKAKRWAKHGLYSVITDYPDKFKNI